ncbi:MAG: hypothetical protein IIY46_00205 [Lachnospiraceae bacterium]|nr:hypothetical protein [Lachnospiraceae bacterium]
MSRGGMTAREFLQVFADKQGFFRRTFASQAYLIALGANDIAQKHPIGTLNDLNASDYLFTAQVIASYMDYIVRHNMEAFAETGLV